MPDQPDQIGDTARHRTWRRSRSPERHSLRRLGPLEYALLGLIILGVAVTIAVAIFNPSG
jgi:hypothetical protein